MKLDVELAPGIMFRSDDEGGRFELRVFDKLGNGKELIICDFEEIKQNPYVWLNSLKLLAQAFEYGPSSVISTVELKNSPKGDLCCNICGSAFRVSEHEYFQFVDTLNGKKYHDFQCSQSCHQRRKADVYRDVMGQEFLEQWSRKLTGNR